MHTNIAYGNPGTITRARVAPPKSPIGPQFLQPGSQETDTRYSELSNDRLTTSDRHAFAARGTERTGRLSGENDPMLSGPSRPSLRVVNRTFNYQQGTDYRNADDRTRPYATNNQGDWIGQKDGSISPVYGGTPGMYQPYGSYGGFTTGPVKGIQSPVALGAPGDGPQSIRSGPPHGLHTATLPDYSQTLGYYMATPQQAPGRIDRPANSRIAGQSYSQTVQPQGQTGTVGYRLRAGAGRATPVYAGRAWRGA